MHDHGPDCPACHPPPLAEEDRRFLEHHGWVGPRHVIPEMADLEWAPMGPFAALCLTGLIGFFWLFLLLMSPEAATGTAATVAGLLWWRWRRHQRHAGTERCRWCARRRRRLNGLIWGDYLRRATHEQDVHRRQWNAANYQRLRDHGD